MTPSPSAGVWAVVPVKDLAQVKQRLAPALSVEQRRGLYRAMLLDVLRALSASARLAGIAVVSRDPEVDELVKPFGVRIIGEDANRGHTAAVQLAAQTLAAEGVAGMLQLPGDLPLVSTHDVHLLLDAHRPPPSVTIAPSRDKKGSNAVLCSPPDGFPLRFGDDSFYPHLAAARRIGIDPVVVESPGLALDIDTPDDLQQFFTTPSNTLAYAYLRDIGPIING